MRATPPLLIDSLKALASQLIVLHHLAFYGPMSDHVAQYLPGLIGWLYTDARMAVQVFLVIGGFLAAQALATSQPRASLAKQLWQRYRRLALPLFAALLLAIAAAALARHILPHPATPAAPGLWQILSHLLLAQQVFGQESLSAGVWYVAIDFQLYATGLILLRLSQRLQLPPLYAPLLLTAASLYAFNRMPVLDIYAPYFFGAYGLGILAQHLSKARHFWPGLLLLALLGTSALLLDFRARIAIAVACALLLACGHRLPALPDRLPLITPLARISYALFLVHYPVCLVVNAVFGRWVAPAPLPQLAGMLLAWGLSLAAAFLFHRHIEKRLTAGLSSVKIARPV